MIGQITRHFSWEEAGTKVPEQYHHNVFKVAGNLELIRLALQCPIIIDSWYRTEKQKNNICHDLTSEHFSGSAVDFHTEKFESLDLWKIMNAMINLSLITKGGLYLLDNFVHYDIRGEKLIKDYTSDLKLDKFINQNRELSNG
jgi:hypothetical protein